MDVDELIAEIKQGAAHEYLLFWGHRSRTGGAVTKSCFSQWFDAPFEFQGKRYLTAEHFMMARKAELFGDLETRDQILAAGDPGKAKALGRQVRNFEERTWVRNRWDVVVEANLLKFGQHDPLRRYLLGTGRKVLVEASPLDAIWGIGLGAEAPEAHDPRQWRGLNLLGFALMEVRDRLAADELAEPARKHAARQGQGRRQGPRR